MSGKKKKVTGPCKNDCILLISNHIRVVTQKCGPRRIGNNHIITDWNAASVILQKKKKIK